MTVVLNPLPFDASLMGTAAVGSFVKFREDGAYLSVIRSTNSPVILKRTAADQYNASRQDTALPSISRIGSAFRTGHGSPDTLVVGPNASPFTLSYASYDTANDKYVWSNGQTVATLAAIAQQVDISSDGAHLAVKAGTAIFVYDISGGLTNAPQIFTASGLGLQGSLAFSPDGNYLAVISNGATKIYRRNGNVYTDISVSGWPSAGGTNYPEWKPNSTQLLAVTTSGVIKIFEKQGDGTFAYMSAKDINLTVTGRYTCKFIGAQNKYMLAMPLSTGGPPQLFSISGLNFTEVPTSIPHNGVTYADVCSSDRGLIAIGFASGAAAPNMGIYRITGDATQDVEGGLIGKKMTAQALVYHGNDTTAQEEIQIRPGVLSLRTPPVQMASQLADYFAVVGALSSKKMIADGLAISGISVMSAELRAKRMQAEGLVTAAGTVQGDLVSKPMVAEGIIEWIKFEITADIVGKKGSFDGAMETVYGLAADFVGKKGALNALVANGGVFWGDFVGKKGSLNAEIYNPFQLSGSFVGPKGYMEAELEEYVGQLVGSFEGKKGSLGAELYNPIVVISDLVGKKGSFSAELSNLQGLAAEFVGKRGYMDGTISRGQRMDAMFVGKRAIVGAELTVNYPPNEARINATLKKINSSMVGKQTRQAVLTFLRIMQ